MVLFANSQESNLRSCVQMVEDVLAQLGHTPLTSRLPAPSAPGPEDQAAQAGGSWRVRRGSAWITATLLTTPAGDNHLKIAARVLVLDKWVDRTKLFARLLELNAGEIVGCAFAVAGQDVVLVAERSTVDLDPSEVHATLSRLEQYADKWDDLLVTEFGGQRAGDQPA